MGISMYEVVTQVARMELPRNLFGSDLEVCHVMSQQQSRLVRLQDRKGTFIHIFSLSNHPRKVLIFTIMISCYISTTSLFSIGTGTGPLAVCSFKVSSLQILLRLVNDCEDCPKPRKATANNKTNPKKETFKIIFQSMPIPFLLLVGGRPYQIFST